jgi:hypothetical protein
MGSRRGPVRPPAEVARHLLAASQADLEPPRDTRARRPFDEVGGKLWSAVSWSTDHLPTTTWRMNAPGRNAGLPVHDDVPLLEHHDSSAEGLPCGSGPASCHEHRHRAVTRDPADGIFMV